MIFRQTNARLWTRDGWFYPQCPRQTDFTIETVAFVLSHTNRYGGHVGLYSVAEHCIIMCEIAPQCYKYDCLMHDASEAYLQDIQKPVKIILPEYNRIERKCGKALAEKFKTTYPVPGYVKTLDTAMCYTEGKALKFKTDIYEGEYLPDFMMYFNRYSPEEAQKEFLRLFNKWKPEGV